MSDVRVTESHSLSTDEAIGRIKSFEEMLTKYGVKTVWKGNQAELKGTGVSGNINVSDSAVDVVVKLGFLAKAAGVKPEKLESSIRRRLGEALGGTTV